MTHHSSFIAHRSWLIVHGSSFIVHNMPLPLFFLKNSAPASGLVQLMEEESKHIMQVLRMKAGEELQLTDGKGKLHTAEIINDHKKSAQARISSTTSYEDPAPQISVALSLVKNASRFEWFLEKATEIGVNEIRPIICERTERHHFRLERMNNIVVSAMLQSRQVWLPKLYEPLTFAEFVQQVRQPQKYIAHCLPKEKQLMVNAFKKGFDSLMLIGPEGDFTSQELELAVQNNFVPVSLGETRLRTETAGIVAVTLARSLNL